MARVLHPDERASPNAVWTSRSRAPFAILQSGSAAATRYLLLLRFAVLNLVAVALLGAAWFKGWVDAAYQGDQTRMVVAIGGVFLAGLVGCAWRTAQTSEDLNTVRGGTVPPWLRLPEATLKLKLGERITPWRHVAGSLVLLGLIGTVVGFIMALSGIVPDAAADVSAVGPMISALIDGMGVALYTTLVGAVLNIWLMLNVRLLEGGAVALVVAVMETRREV